MAKPHYYHVDDLMNDPAEMGGRQRGERLKELRLDSDDVEPSLAKKPMHRPWYKSIPKQYLGGMVVLVLVTVGLGVGVYLQLFTDFDIRNMAWGGLRVNESVLQQGQQYDPANFTYDPNRVIDPNSQEAQFNRWLEQYPGADTMDISLPQFSLSGIAFNAYDQKLDKTAVYVLLENVPVITGFTPYMWVEKMDGTYLKLASGELVMDFPPQTYFTALWPGNSNEYKTVHFSFEGKTVKEKPELVFLSLDVHEEGN